MLLKEILSQIKLFIKTSPLAKFFIKTSLKAQKQLKSDWDRFWDYTIKKNTESLKSKRKPKQMEKALESLTEKSLEKDLIEETQKIEAKNLSKNVNQIDKLLQAYEQLIQKDFFMIIREANATLRSWKADLVRMLANNAVTNEYGVESLSTNLQEITALYHHSGAMLESFSQHCLEYDEIVKDAKRIINPSQQLNQVQSQLSKMRRGLEKGRELMDLEQNQDFTYLSRYVKEKSQGRALI